MCYDIVAKHLRSSKYTALEKGILRSVSCGATWTRVFARSKGYDFPEKCPLGCGGRDILFHRLWKCPCLEQERRELVDPGILDGIDSFVENRQLLFAVTRGGLPHPGDELPAPLAEGSWHVKWHVPAPEDLMQTQGQILLTEAALRTPSAR